MIRLLKTIFLLVLFTFSVNSSLYAQRNKSKDSSAVKKDTLKLRYDFKNTQKGGLFLDDLAKKEVIFDKTLNKYVIVEKIGDYYTKTPIFLTQKEYAKYRLKRDMLQYFKEKVSATNSKKNGSADTQKDLLPTYYVNSKFFESIFGGNSVKVTPTGNLNLKLGFIYQNTENPQISEENRSSLTFDFDQQINASIRAKVGKRLEFTANYDTQSTFDFQNLVKIEFNPPSLDDPTYSEDGIIQEIDAGNIAMPIKNSLINGAQSLFGIKTRLQFGNTNITAVFSQQNSESKTVVAEAGASIEEFELRTTDYDNDRHFFLSQFFIDNYANSLKQYPLISSQVNITRIEVWITNRNATTEDFRSIVAFADLGETDNANSDNNFYRNLVASPNTITNSVTPISINSGGQQLYLPQNNANNIYDETNVLPGIRDVSSVDPTLNGRFQMQQGTDYSILENARKLDANEYRLNSQLGYISLNRRLNDGEVLAVAYEYTVAGTVNGTTEKSFKVGEFSNDGVQAPQNLAVKLLRSEILQTVRENTTTGNDESFPTWRLMMKNVYALGAYPLTQDGFRFEIQYRDDETGIASNVLQNSSTPDIPNLPLIQVLKLDQLDQSQYRNADGFFDYVEGITVNSQNGFIIFPEPEPFGNDLVLNASNPNDVGLDENVDSNFLFKELYLNTKVNIKNNFQNKDKYFLKGYFKSESAGGIPIGAFNVPRGSVKVTAGGRQLVEGVDYVVDYQLGRVQIIDPGLRASGTPINVSTENNAVFNQQRKTFMGVDIEHKFSDDLVVGATVLNVNERPLTPKVNFGAEPINNTMFGVNLDFSSEVPYFTKLANKLPFVDTDVISNLSVRADMAYLLPGTPSGIDVAGAATSYIDDFEASQIPISLLSALDWYEASTPRNDLIDRFNGKNSDLSYNHKRGKLAWYSVDQIFYGLGETPASITADELSRAETRQINYNELFPNQQFDITQNTLLRTLDLAYFPQERGSYNFNMNTNEVNDNGTFINPEENWGGIMRSLTTNNFDQANVEYIQFWVMDPYDNYSITEAEGLPQDVNPTDVSNQIGDLYINLGNISEDIVKDNRKMFENGLPEDGVKLLDSNINTTIWGDVPRNPSIIYAFSEDDAARTFQDVGFDGLNDAEELTKLADNLGISEASLPNYLQNDPASDNFQFFRSDALDAINASIITRYKDYNNTQGNSPTLNQSTQSFPTSSSTYPDVEDINRDQTMNTIESYFEYRISMNKSDLQKDKNFIVDEKITSVTLENGDTQQTKWYQFRVPVRNGTAVNGITDFNSIRFVRMYLTNFKMPVVLRFGELDLVRGDWRRYTKTIDPNIDPVRDLDQTELEGFEVGVVSIEQNNGSYIEPPGIERERLQGTTTVQLQNEQSVTLKVLGLEPDKTRAIYKNISVDLRRFKNLKMFMHLGQINSEAPIQDDEFSAIIRLGTDLNDNFYQIEVPLKVSGTGGSQLDIWPEANNLDALLETFGKLKVERDGMANLLPNDIYPEVVVGESAAYRIRVKGNPTLAQLRTITLGLKNNSSSNKSGEVWFNELRSAGFDNKGGWAAVVNADANFADVANVSLSGSMQTIGFGNVEDRVNQRSLNETKQYDVATTISIDKVLTPKKWGLQIPMSYSVGEKFVDPKYDPQYQDVEYSVAKSFLESQPQSTERDKAIENINNSQDYTRRTSISFINVKKNRNPNSTKKPKFYDVENLAVSYSHNREFHKDYNIEKYINENVMASATYNFNFNSKPIEIFKNSKRFKSKYWKFIKDLNINPIPSTVAINSRINRSYNEQQSRNLVSGLSAQPELKQRRFLFDWDYAVGFNLTKSLQVNFNATNNYIYDAFGSGEELQIFDNFFNTGRPNQYHQKLNGTYNLPLDKFPFLAFLKADYAYTADFDWQVSSQDQEIATQIGNAIQNANTHNLNTTLTFDKIYKSIGFEKLLLTKSQRKNAKGKNIRNIRPKKTLPTGKKILKITWDLLTSVKQGKISYSENNGQYLQGYDEGIGFLGGSPTGFAFGSQVDIRNKALLNGWLVNPRALVDDINTTDIDESTYYNKSYSRTHYNKLDYTFTLKPLKDLSIDVRGNKIQTRDISQQLDIVEDGTINGAIDYGIDTFETGNFSTSHSMFATAFTSGDVLFQKMKDYRTNIANRFALENPTLDPTAFGKNSQQVLLPAFMAAYSGKNPDKVNTSLFRDIPIPNWTLRYNGFMKMKWFKKNFTSFVVSHGYRSSYTISSFTNNLAYKEGQNIINTNSGSFEPQRLISSATLVDEFSPLIKIDMKMRNSFSFRSEIKRDRTLTMNFNNSTLTDIAGTEYIIGLGYVFKDVKMNTRFTGKKTTLKGDLNLRADVSLRDNLTQIRYVDEDNNQISGGQRLFSIKFTADYTLSSNLTASFYYNHQTSKYAISTTFPRQAINGGINIVYNLGGN